MVQILLINFNHFKHLKKHIYAALFKGIWWKTNHVTFGSIEKRPRFCTSLYIFGTWGDVAGFKYEWKVKGECILSHYFYISYLINSQLNRVCDTKIDTSCRITQLLKLPNILDNYEYVLWKHFDGSSIRINWTLLLMLSQVRYKAKFKVQEDFFQAKSEI